MNPLVYVGKLILGILLAIVSFLWIIHILVGMLIEPNGVPTAYFLNNLFNFFVENNVAFLATLFYGTFSLHMLWSTMKGNFKFGIRIPLIFSFHPMKFIAFYKKYLDLL